MTKRTFRAKLKLITARFSQLESWVEGKLTTGRLSPELVADFVEAWQTSEEVIAGIEAGVPASWLPQSYVSRRDALRAAGDAVTRTHGAN